MQQQLKIRSNMVFGFHGVEDVECPEVIRQPTGGYIACAHDSHKVDESGNRILEADRKERLLNEVVPEVERRFQDQRGRIDTRERIAKPKSPGVKRKTAKQPADCLCECGGQTKGGRFLPGHDAKLKSKLLAALRDSDASTADRVTALSRLEELGWGRYVTEQDRGAL